MTTAQTFKALGDPVRLAMIERLSAGPADTVGDLTTGLGLTRQGARKHLQLLVEAGLVKLQPTGRQTVISLQPSELKAVNAYIAGLERNWDQRLEALQNYVEQQPGSDSHR